MNPYPQPPAFPLLGTPPQRTSTTTKQQPQLQKQSMHKSITIFITHFKINTALPTHSRTQFWGAWGTTILPNKTQSTIKQQTMNNIIANVTPHFSQNAPLHSPAITHSGKSPFEGGKGDVRTKTQNPPIKNPKI